MTLTIESWKKVATERIREAICKNILGHEDNSGNCPVCAYVKKNYGIHPFSGDDGRVKFNCEPFAHWQNTTKADQIGIGKRCPARETCIRFCDIFDLFTTGGKLRAFKRIYKQVSGKEVPAYFVYRGRRVYTDGKMGPMYRL